MEKNRTLSNDLADIVSSDERVSAMEWLAEQMPGGFFIYRAQEPFEILFVNQSTFEIFGCETREEFDELTGNTFRGMVHPDDYGGIQTSIDDQIKNSANTRNMDYVVYRIIRKDGAVRWVDDYGRFASIPGVGDVYYVFISDITDTRLAAEEKEKTHELQLALEAAEKANVSKSAFLSNMSHEIRTPITAILGMNEMIQREAEDSGILEYSENIRKAGVSLLGIISDILDFSKIETGKMELECEEYELSSVVEDLYNLVRFRTEAKGLDLDFAIDPSLPCKLIGDEVRVKQIITNLLTNAAKYTEKGHILFEMRQKERYDSDDGKSFVTLEVSVTDTGIGIRPEEMDRLFEPFDRLDMKKTRTIEGSGLGLAITRQMLSIMESELKVESKYEEGSRFYFVLRQQVGDDTPVGEISFDTFGHEKRDTARRHTLFTAPGMRILVVDDTPMNLQVIAGLLKRTRMHIDVATSGKECIEMFGKQHYDLVFLDYRMPQMNGIETLHMLSSEYPVEYEKTPVISLTASAVSGDKERMLRAGFTDYLSKPVNIEEMEHMLIKYLPSESVIIAGENDGEEDDELAKLPAVIYDYPQLNPEKGIEYCGDADDYIYALETYEVSIESKASQIEECVDNNDLEAYTLNVHSLKSTSGAIGAMDLFEKAKALEMAGKEGDCETIRRETPVLLKDYRAMRGILRRIIGKYELSEETSSSALAVVEEERSRMLARALSEAEEANLAKTAFLSNMSHEIRMPMNSIIGLYNIALRKPNLDDDMREILSNIGASAKHLLSLLNDILDISLIESGHATLRHEEFFFGSMIEKINTMAEALCEDKGLTYDCTVRGHMDNYYIGDDMKLTQMIINVLGNAVKYTPAPGRVTLTVEEAARGENSSTIKFTVKDTGIGISESYIPRLFEPFSQEIEGKSNEYGSTGLGMAITKNIADMMSGDISVTSEKGRGSEFVISIPLEHGRSDAEGTVFDPGSIHALVVDDDITACEHAKMVLKRVGIEADCCQSGEDAQRMIEKQKALKQGYRIIFIDWKMPGMDGIELTRAIRARQEENELITIILTTYNWDEIMEIALDAGVDAFLAKPLFSSSIREELKDILSETEQSGRRVTNRVGLAGRRILLVEDMDINAEITRQVLKLRDIESELVSDGRQAVDRFTESPEGTYDAILMDIRMPVMSGLEASRAIRESDKKDAESIPIIALTANAFDEDVQMSLDAGMNAHLSKPVEPDALFQTLESLIRSTN